MKRYTLVISALIAILIVVGTGQAKEEITSKQKKKLSSLLHSIETRAKQKKPRKHEIAVPVATAGVRGAAAEQSNQFAVVWPGLDISPLSALAENLKHDSSDEASAKDLKAQVEDFLTTFPEFKDEPLLKEVLQALE